MSLGEKKAVDVMKKASGKDVVATSVTSIPHGFCGVLKNSQEIICVTDGACAFADRLECSLDEYKFGLRVRIAPMNNKNSHALRLFLKWTAPQPCANDISSVGFEDDFGVVLPVLAESLNLMNVKPVLVSSFDNMENLSSSMGNTAWQALSIGLKGGYSAEYACVNDESEIMNVLLSGYTGIVIECANKINNDVLSAKDQKEKFDILPDEFKNALISSYLDKQFKLPDDTFFSFEEEELISIVIKYGELIAYLQYLYNGYFKNTPWPVAFNLKCGELDFKEHYLLANELTRAKTMLSSLELDFTCDGFNRHLAVARDLGHKLRIVITEENINKISDFANTSDAKIDIRMKKGQNLLDFFTVVKRAGREQELNLSSYNNDEELLMMLIEKKPQLKELATELKDDYLEYIKSKIEILKKFFS